MGLDGVIERTPVIIGNREFRLRPRDNLWQSIGSILEKSKPNGCANDLVTRDMCECKPDKLNVISKTTIYSRNSAEQ